MKELKCPNCGKVFSVDESEYATIVNQVRTAEFEEDLHRRLEELSKTKDAGCGAVETTGDERAAVC